MASAKYIEYILEKECAPLPPPFSPVRWSRQSADASHRGRSGRGDVAAVIAEPVRWTPYVPPPEYWQHVRAACDKHGALLILDEIPNSLGRTGAPPCRTRYGMVQF
eukprot:SAG11_NODE_581_length_8363_cov_13.931873_2_plen_106_part_00